MFKKSAMLAAALSAAMLAFAYETETVNGIEWKYVVDNGKASLCGGSGWPPSPSVPKSTAGAIVIPSTLGGYPVTSIGDYAFNNCSGLTSIAIPNSVTSIGDYAFINCSGLTSIAIPNSVTSIGSSAFYGCSGLTSIAIPNSVTSIGSSAFQGCSGLTSIAIPNSVTSIGDYAFYGCSGLKSLTIPDSVAFIGGMAFADCHGLASIKFPNGRPVIALSAFDGTPAYSVSQWRPMLSSEGVLGGELQSSAPSGGSSSGYAISDTVGNSTITSMTVNGDTAIDSFLLADGKVFDMAIRIVNTANAAVTLALPEGYTYETVKGTSPLTIPANSTNIITITRTAERVFLVAREELSTVQ